MSKQAYVKAYPQEFRDKVVQLVQVGKAPARAAGLCCGGALRRTRTDRPRVVPAGVNNKPKGSSAGSRGAFIVPGTAGNRVRWDPSEGRGASYEPDPGGKRRGNQSPGNALHGTAGDSRSERAARICHTRSLVRQLRTLASVGGEAR